MLENETAFPLGPGLALVGVGDPWSGRFHPERAMMSLNETVPRLVLSHQPDTFEPLAEYRCDLVLSGHTHGGQVRLPVIGAILPWIARVVRTVLPKHIVSKVSGEGRRGGEGRGFFGKCFGILGFMCVCMCVCVCVCVCA